MYIFNPIPTMNQAQGVAQTCRVSPNFLVDPPPAMAAEKTQIMCDDSEVRRLQVGGPGRYFFRVDLYIYIHICIHIIYIFSFYLLCIFIQGSQEDAALQVLRGRRLHPGLELRLCAWRRTAPRAARLLQDPALRGLH